MVALERVALRVSGFDQALWMTLPHLLDEDECPSEAASLSTWMSLAADEFDLLENVAFRVVGNEPIRLLVLPNDDD